MTTVFHNGDSVDSFNKMMDDADEEETSISILHNVAYIHEDAAGGFVTIPQYHMYSGAIPKDVTASASHHALNLAYHDLKKRYDHLMKEKQDQTWRHSPQLRRSKHGSGPLVSTADRRTKSSTLPLLPSQTPNDVSHDAVVLPPPTRSRSPVFRDAELQLADGGKTAILQTLLKGQDEEIANLKNEVADLRLTIAGRERREPSTGTSSDYLIHKTVKQMQAMKKQLQEQTQIIQKLLKKKAAYDVFEHRSISGLDLHSSRVVSVDFRTENKLIVSIDEEDTSDYAMPNVRAEDDADMYGMPTLHADPMSAWDDERTEGRDGNWDEPATLGAIGGDMETPGATGGEVGNQYRRGALPPRAPLNIEYNVGTGPKRSSHDNVGLSVNFHTQVSEQRQPEAVLNNDPLAGHKPLTSHRNIFHAEATADKVPAHAEAATVIECPVCSQQFDVPQNSPEFQHHVDECLQNAGSPEGSPRRCPLCNTEFAATVDQKDYEMHVNRHFDNEDIIDRFHILDFAHTQNN